MKISSDVDICNLAVGWLGGNSIMAIDGSDESVEAILCRANYASARNVTLEARDWTFALGRVIPAAMANAPAFGYGVQFLLPSDFLKVREVSGNPKYDDRLNWEKEGRHILCDTTTVYIKYTKEITDVGQFSPNFIQALASRLAADICMTLTDSKTMMREMEAKYAVFTDIASGADGSQGINQKVVSNELIRIR